MLGGVLAEGGAAVVCSPPGVGKTRLVEEAARASGRPVFRLVATAGSARIPLGVFVDPTLSTMDPVAIAAAVRARGDRVCLLVDDAHHLDEASAGLVHQLHVTGVPVLATLRTGLVAPEPITALWKADGGRRISLAPLPPADVAILLERVLGGQVDTGTARELARRSAGNPLLLRELVRAALAADVLADRHGVWRLGAELPFGDRLADLVPARLESLTDAQRRAVELLALAEPLEPMLLGGRRADAIVESLEDQGLVSVDLSVPGRRLVRFNHPLFAEAVRARLTASRRVRRYGELADATAAGSGAEVGELRRGLWELEAARAQPVEALLRLSGLAGPLAPNLAERFARAAVTAGGGVPAALHLAAVLAHSHRHAEAEQVLAELGTPADPAERVAVLATRAMSLSFAPHQPARALALLDEAPDLAEVPAIRALRATALMRLGDFPAGEEIATPMVGDETLPPAARLYAALNLLAVWALGGRGVGVTALAELALELADRAGGEIPEAATSSRLLDGLGRYVRGDVAAEEAMARAGYARALEDGAEGDRLQFAQVLGRVLVARGRPREAARYLRETLAGGGLWWDATLPWTRALLAEALVLAGDSAGARAVIDAADAAPCSGCYTAQVLLAGAYVEAGEGAISAAIARARRAGEYAEAWHHDGTGLFAWYAAVRFGDPSALAGVRSEAARMDGALAPAVVAHATAIAGGAAGGQHEAAAKAFAAMGMRLFEAEARAFAVRAYRAAGRTGPAALAAERLRVTLAELEPLSSPVLLAGQRWDALTRREAEVARLAAGGLPDRDIARRLNLSVRTVTTHLTRVYAKLGLAGRRDLAAELGTT